MKPMQVPFDAITDVPIGEGCDAVKTLIGAFAHLPQLGDKISMQFVIAHLRLTTFLCNPLPHLSHLLDLLLLLVVILIIKIKGGGSKINGCISGGLLILLLLAT